MVFGSFDLPDVGGPLEAIRRFRGDQDQRRKDREWREPLERERMETENAIAQKKLVEASAKAQGAELEVQRKRLEFLIDLVGPERARSMMADELLGPASVDPPSAGRALPPADS